jgi:alpha-ketoglutarate-dependent taurine dioxygenase
MITILPDCNDIDDIESSIIDSKIIGFKKVNLNIDEQVGIMTKLLTDEEIINNPLDEARGHNILENVYNIVNEAFLMRASPTEFLGGNWHQDNTDDLLPPSYISMCMTKYACSGKGVGDTAFIDLEEAYLNCPDDIKSYLDGVDVRHISPNTEPEGVVRWAYRTHPVTGNISLYYSNDSISPSGGMTMEFQNYMDWFKEYRGNEDNIIRWEWDVGDFIIWDNRNILHSVSGGWKIGDRIFNKVNSKPEEPINGRKQG